MIKHFLISSMLLGALCATAADQEMEFSYAMGNMIQQSGYGIEGTYDIAIKIDDPDYVGLNVIGAQIYGCRTAADGVQDYKIWARNALTDANLQEQAVTVANNGTASASFQPITLTKDGLYVGFSFNVPTAKTEKTQYPIPVSAPQGVANSLWLNFNNRGWEDLCERSGSATIVVFLSGELRSNALAVEKIVGNPIINKDVPFQLTFRLINNATEPIRNVDYSYTVNGKTKTGSGNLPISGRAGARYDVTFNFDPIATSGQYPLEFAITKVNGVKNGSTRSTLNTDINIQGRAAKKRPVMEEGTGTWCVWCPRGWVAMQQLKKKYPDFIGMAYHSGDDPMVVTYNPPIDVSGLPSCNIDRSTGAIDPFTGAGAEPMGIEAYYLAQCKTAGVADIAISSEWKKDGAQLDVRPIVTFGTTVNDQYRLAYALLANGVTDPGNAAYAQKNAYRNNQDAVGLLAALKDMPNPITDMVYDEVVVKAEAVNGVAASLPANPEIEKPYSARYVFDTSSFKNVNGQDIPVDRDDMEVVVMILNSQGKIVNANKAKAGVKVGIEDVIETVQDLPVEYYDLQGRRVNDPQHGIFIKRQGNKATKVIL